MKSELSGKPAVISENGKVHGLNAHHIMGKPNFRLRYELLNGISLTQGEHKFGVHHAGRAEEYRGRIIAHIGQQTWDYLQSLKSGVGGSITGYQIFLESELRKIIIVALGSASLEERYLILKYIEQHDLSGYMPATN